MVPSGSEEAEPLSVTVRPEMLTLNCALGSWFGGFTAVTDSLAADLDLDPPRVRVLADDLVEGREMPAGVLADV